MDTQSTPKASSPIDDIFSLTLVDGLPVVSGGKTIRYREVRLRETNVADERIAERQAERLVMVGGVHKLVVSDAAFSFGMTVRHIERFGCDGNYLVGDIIDAELVGKLSSHDLHLIEQRCFLISLAAEVRYGNITQQDFDFVVAGGTLPGAQSPQPEGQAAGVGVSPAAGQPGPQMLADFAGGTSDRAPAGHG